MATVQENSPNSQILNCVSIRYFYGVRGNNRRLNNLRSQHGKAKHILILTFPSHARHKIVKRKIKKHPFGMIMTTVCYYYSDREMCGKHKYHHFTIPCKKRINFHPRTYYSDTLSSAFLIYSLLVHK